MSPRCSSLLPAIGTGKAPRPAENGRGNRGGITLAAESPALGRSQRCGRAVTVSAAARSFHHWREVQADIDIPELVFEPVPFEHPLWILYSSGTTSKPKAIVQGHGGILLEHMKALALHLDLREGDSFFWYTTSGWMMWNFLVSGLLLPGVIIALFEGSPKHPDFNVLRDFVERHGIDYFGASALSLWLA